MQWLTPWTIAGAVLCVLALVVLFFPFVFKIDFEASLSRAWARLYFFRKLVYEASKNFKTDKSADAEINEDDLVPEYVPPKKKAEVLEEAKVPAPKKETKAAPKEDADAVKNSDAEKSVATQNEEECLDKDTAADKKIVPVVEKIEVEESKEGSSKKEMAQESKTDAPKDDEFAPEQKDDFLKDEPKGESKNEPSRKEKRSLTDKEFWTILLTPEFDETAFWAFKKWLFGLLRLFKVQFRDCFVEGIRGDVLSMGYGAALNGILRAYPYVGAWDLRMDWTHDHELRAAGQIHASVNVCRILGLVIASVFYGGIIAYKFWRRRARVLKTNELPELGWIRTKIVKMMAEE